MGGGTGPGRPWRQSSGPLRHLDERRDRLIGRGGPTERDRLSVRRPVSATSSAEGAPEAPAPEARVNVGWGRRQRTAELGKRRGLGQGNWRGQLPRGAERGRASSGRGDLDLASRREPGLAGERWQSLLAAGVPTLSRSAAGTFTSCTAVLAPACATVAAAAAGSTSPVSGTVRPATARVTTVGDSLSPYVSVGVGFPRALGMTAVWPGPAGA